MSEPFFKCAACGESFDWDTADSTKHFFFRCNPDYVPDPVALPLTYVGPEETT